MNLTELIIGTLVTYRLSTMAVNEIGPNGIFAKFRAYLASKQTKIGGFYDMFSCVSCISMYIAFLTAILLAGSVLEVFMYTCAFSGLTKLIIALFSSKS